MKRTGQSNTKQTNNIYIIIKQNVHKVGIQSSGHNVLIARQGRTKKWEMRARIVHFY